MKRALITGINGQDGSYLSELLLGKGYEVFGLVRRSSSIKRARIDHLTQGGESRVRLIYGDMNDGVSLYRVLNWRPRTTFRELVRMMIDADLAYARSSTFPDQQLQQV